jgi:acetyl esterase/lipase
VAILLHGGCWRSIADLSYMEPLAAALGEAGWATWNLEFRTVDQPGGAWPGIFHDVAAGIDQLRTLGWEYPLDVKRVVTVGHSSGGHLALWAASRQRVPARTDLYDPTPLPVRGAVSLGGIADLEAYHALGLDACEGAVVQLLGGAPAEQGDRLAQASPPALLPNGVPQLLVTGEDDHAVPPEHGEAYAARAREAGQQAEHHTIPGAGHFEVVAPWTQAWGAVWERVDEFLGRVAGG